MVACSGWILVGARWRVKKHPVATWLGRLLVSATIFFVVLRRVDLSAITIRLDSRTLVAVLVTIGFLLCAQLLSAFRWRVLLGPDAPPLMFMWRLYSVGAFFSLFLPTVVGGDAVRVTAALKAFPNPAVVIISVLTDRVLGVLALLVYALVGATVLPDLARRIVQSGSWSFTPLAERGLIIGAFAVALIPIVLFRTSAGFRRVIQPAVGTVTELAAAPRTLISAIILALAVQAAYIFSWSALVYLLAIPVPLSVMLLAVPFVSLATMLPVTLAGIGVREGAWGFIFSLLGLAPSDGVALALLYFGCVFCVGLAGGAVFLLRGTALESARRFPSWPAGAPLDCMRRRHPDSPNE